MSSGFHPPDRPRSANQPSFPQPPSSSSSNHHPYLRSSTFRANSSVTSLPNLLTRQSTLSGTLTSHYPVESEHTSTLLQHAFVPHIAVHASDDTNALARDKGFEDFKELLRPYGETVTGKINIRDSQGLGQTYDDFGIRITGMWDLLDDGIMTSSNGPSLRPGGGLTATGKIPTGGGNLDDLEKLMAYHVDRAEETKGVMINGDDSSGQSMYNLFLRRMLSRMPVSPHETFTHPVACIIAISSRNPNPIEALRKLYDSGNQVPIPLYVSRDYLRYYVLVHDDDRDDFEVSSRLFDQMKKHFGLHCHLLRLRSTQTIVSDDGAVVVPQCRWISAAEELQIIKHDDDMTPPKCLYDTDALALRTLVREMVVQSLIPFMERCVSTWNDQVASKRRGISGKFFSLSRRYLGTSSSSSRSSSSSYDSYTSSYPPHTPEATMRKLADFAFMLRDFKLAHSTYDVLRSDYQSDKAWKYHAASQEMTALTSILLSNAQPLYHQSSSSSSKHFKPSSLEPLLDVACYSYLSRCRDRFAFTRCILLTVELLRTNPTHIDAAAQYACRALDTGTITLPPVLSAFITERVADCFAVRASSFYSSTSPIRSRRRKMAMWKVLAAEKWADMGKRWRVREVLDGVDAVYANVEWGGLTRFIEGLRDGWEGEGGDDGSETVRQGTIRAAEDGAEEREELGVKKHVRKKSSLGPLELLDFGGSELDLPLTGEVGDSFIQS